MLKNMKDFKKGKWFSIRNYFLFAVFFVFNISILSHVVEYIYIPFWDIAIVDMIITIILCTLIVLFIKYRKPNRMNVLYLLMLFISFLVVEALWQNTIIVITLFILDIGL